MKKINVAVLGYGHLGKWHCQKVEACSQANLLAIVEKFPANQELAKKAHPHAKVVGDITEIMTEIDAAIIVTPTSTHYELCKQLLKNKKHIFCEKPLCGTYSESLELKKLLQTNQVLQVGHSERCHAIWDKAVNYGLDINKKFIAKIERVAPFKGRATDVDVVQDLMIHDLDLMLYVLQKKPVSLTAFGQKIRTKNYDHVVCYLDFQDGSTLSIISGRNAVKEIRSLEVCNTDGIFYFDLFKNELIVAINSIFDNNEYVKSFSYEKRDHLLIEHQAFYKAIETNGNIFVDINAGIKAVYLVEMVLKSLATGKRVELSL